MPLKETVECLSAEMRKLGTGPLAELRRMKPDGPGVAGYWHLAGKCGFLEADETDTWMRIVKIMAILTPKGEPQERRPPHDPKRRLGTVLCDGGDPAWAEAQREVRPIVSETRLARLLAQEPKQRAEALERVARMLAAGRDPASGVNCTDIAALLLYPDEKDHLRALARAYYRRLDTAVRKADQEETAA